MRPLAFVCSTKIRLRLARVFAKWYDAANPSPRTFASQREKSSTLPKVLFYLEPRRVSGAPKAPALPALREAPKQKRSGLLRAVLSDFSFARWYA